MATKTKETALATVEEYALFQSGQGTEILEAIIENTGGGDVSQFDLDRIMLPSGSGAPQFTIPGLEEPEYVKTFQGVIVAHRTSRVYWESDTPKKGTPPDCVSNDGLVGFGRLDLERGTEQLPSGGFACESCALAQWDSSSRGKGQACKLNRPLFILTPDDTLPKLLIAPPSALTNLRKYGLQLGKRGMMFHHAVTEFFLEPASSGGGIDYSRLNFRFAGVVDERYRDEIEAFAKKVKGFAGAAVQAAMAEDGDLQDEPF